MTDSDRPLTAAVLRHHLALFGIPGRILASEISFAGESEEDDAAVLARLRREGGLMISECPDARFLASLNDISSGRLATPAVGVPGSNNTLRSLFDISTFSHTNGTAWLISEAGDAAWLSIPAGKGQVLLLGSALSRDLVRYRQGDPAKADQGQKGEQWGFQHERPNYLFEHQAGVDRLDRQADRWAQALALAVSRLGHFQLTPMLPNGAKGAVVITGDDDQAYLEKYDEQIRALSPLPMTYYLHPETRHDRTTLKKIGKQLKVELALHPDALDDPSSYTATFRRQHQWFRELTGRSPRSVRNHGYLNDGYWRHLDAWLESDIDSSANIPGLDGTVLNGSLLPSRLVYKDHLTKHWSILTAIGDGVLFALKMSPQQARDCIQQLSNRIQEDEIPGVIVLNLHPQNITESLSMHEVLHELVAQGLVAWTMSECIDWFRDRDNQGKTSLLDRPGIWIGKALNRERWRS